MIIVVRFRDPIQFNNFTGLAFDERVEVCVWPGSLPEGQPCAGSSEIAPVPRERFNCPHEQGEWKDFQIFIRV